MTCWRSLVWLLTSTGSARAPPDEDSDIFNLLKRRQYLLPVNVIMRRALTISPCFSKGKTCRSIFLVLIPGLLCSSYSIVMILAANSAILFSVLRFSYCFSQEKVT